MRSSLVLSLLLAFFLGLSAAAQSADTTVQVVFPKREGESIYTAVNKGIRSAAERLGVEVQFSEAEDRSSARRIARRANRNGAVIALGSDAAGWLREGDTRAKLVVGGVDQPADPSSQVSGVTLLADPSEALARLRAISPETERVFIVFKRDTHEWLIESAKLAARQLGLEIIPLQASSLSEATSHYWNILRYANPRHDALWLLPNRTLLSDRDTLPRIVEESWSKRFVVFSNSLAHVDRGIVFAVYIDPVKLGEELLEKAVQAANGNSSGISASRAYQSALNFRVARHHGLSISPAQRETFDIVLEGRE